MSVSNAVDRHVLLVPAIIVIAGVLSAYTTADGVYSILKEWGQIPAGAAAAGFATILGSAMIYLTFEARRRRGTASVLPVVVLYLVVAAVSIFFNFNSIFSAFASQDLAVADARRLRTAVSTMIASGDTHLRGVYQVDKLYRAAEAAKNAAEFEATREDRPGRKQRYIRLKEKWVESQSALVAATNLYDRDRQELAALASQLGPERSLPTFEDANAEVRRIASIHADVTSWLTARGAPISIADRSAADVSRNRRSVAVALTELARNIQLSLSDTAGIETRFHFWLAIILSCVLDLLVFAIVLILPRTGAVAKPAAAVAISEPIRWDPL